MKSGKRKLIPAIIIFLLGLIVTVIGALFKIQHWPYGNEIIIFGNLLEILGIVLAIIILIRIYRAKP